MYVLFFRKKSTWFWISRNYKKTLKKQRFSHFLSIFLIFCKVLYDCITKNIKNKNIYRCSDDAKSNKCCFFYNFKDHYFNCKLIFFMIFFVKKCSFLHYKNNLTFQNKSQIVLHILFVMNFILRRYLHCKINGLDVKNIRNENYYTIYYCKNSY